MDLEKPVKSSSEAITSPEFGTAWDLPTPRRTVLGRLAVMLGASDAMAKTETRRAAQQRVAKNKRAEQIRAFEAKTSRRLKHKGREGFANAQVSEVGGPPVVGDS
jgi:hypothetical protein